MGKFRLSARLCVYELVLVLKSELSEELTNNIKDKVNSLISSFDGQIVKFEDWGKKKLAYPIKKETKGHYLYWYYKAKPTLIIELERNLRLNENVLRFATFRLTPQEIKLNENMKRLSEKSIEELEVEASVQEALE